MEGARGTTYTVGFEQEADRKFKHHRISVKVQMESHVLLCLSGPLKHEARSKQQCEEVWETWGDAESSSGDLTLSKASAPSSMWKTLETQGNMDAQGT